MKAYARIIILTLFVASILGATWAYQNGNKPATEQPPDEKNADVQKIVGVALNGDAYEVTLSLSQDPVVQQVRTKLPTLRYFGRSLDGRFMAYVPNLMLDPTSGDGTRVITRDELAKNADVSLVPSPHLYLEDGETGNFFKVAPEAGDTVVEAAWSPRNENLIAFTVGRTREFREDETPIGLVLYNMQEKSIEVLAEKNVLADFVKWSDSGRQLQFFEVAGSTRTSEDGFIMPTFASTHKWVGVDGDADPMFTETWTDQLPVLPAASGNGGAYDNEEAVIGSQPFMLRLRRGGVVRADTLSGLGKLRVYDSTDTLLKEVKADTLVAVDANGVVYATLTDLGWELHFLKSTGEDVLLIPVKAGAKALNYLLPVHSGASPDATVTQVGNGYSTACKVFSHTGNLAYAYDFGAAAGNERVLAAADGWTTIYNVADVRCNSLDNGSDCAGEKACCPNCCPTCPPSNCGNGYKYCCPDASRCPDYSPSCSSSWGNYAMLQHTDGTWTLYAHMRPGSVILPDSTHPVSIGCQLGIEGHTGRTSGCKNRCGDHIHFQRQTKGGTSAPSVSVTFSDVNRNPLSCREYESGNNGRSCNI